MDPYRLFLTALGSNWYLIRLKIDLVTLEYVTPGLLPFTCFRVIFRFRRLVVESPSAPRLRVTSICFLQISSISRGVDPEFPKFLFTSIDSLIRQRIVWVTYVPITARFRRFTKWLLPLTLEFTFYTEL